MAKTFTPLRNQYGKLTNNSSSGNLTLGDEMMNDYLRNLYGKQDWPFLHRLRTATTVASTTFVGMSGDIDKVESVFVTVSSTRYSPKPAPSRNFWDELHYSVQTSDTPQYWIDYNSQIGLWPRPSSAGNTISINGKIKPIDLSIADYTTGNITTTSTSAGVTTVTGSGVTWTAQMVGLWIRITYTTTANTGDGVWYEIASVPTATTMTLIRPYGGTAISGGSAAYTIGQFSYLPEAFQNLPMYAGIELYYTSIMPEQTRAEKYGALRIEQENSLFKQYGFENTSMVLDSGDYRELINPNLIIKL